VLFRSAIAASILQQKGFDNIYNVTCGINGWKQAGFDLETETHEEILA
jgi:rhodanese-related sulfurtransferase